MERSTRRDDPPAKRRKLNDKEAEEESEIDVPDIEMTEVISGLDDVNRLNTSPSGVLVVQHGSNGITLMSRDGKKLPPLPNLNVGVSSISAIASGRDGSTYVAVRRYGLVRIKDGTPATTIYKDPAVLMESIAVGPNNSIYICDADSLCVYRLVEASPSVWSLKRFMGVRQDRPEIIEDPVKEGDALSVTLREPIRVFVSHITGTVFVRDSECIRMYEGTKAKIVARLTTGPPNSGTHHFGELPDGSLVLVLGGRLTRIKDGNISVLYDFSGSYSPLRRTFFRALAVDSETGSVFLASATTVWKVEGLTRTDSRYLLSRSINYEPDHIIRIGTQDLRVHKCLASQRCPLLLSPETLNLLNKPIDAKSVEMFRQHLYSDVLPSELSAQQLMELAYLFDVAGFDDRVTHCMRLLAKIKLPKETAVQDLMALYCYAQELQPFKRGEKIAIRLMRENRDLLVPHTNNFRGLLGRYSHKDMDLVAALIASADGPLDEPQDRAGKCALSLKDALQRMYDSRNKDGDFEIVLKECQPRKVHSMVMYAVWPYFRQMIDCGMKEKSERRLALPCAGEDGGLSEEVLDLIVELAYRREMTQQMLDHYVSADVALNIVFISDLYFSASAGVNLERNVDDAYGRLKNICVDFLVANDESCIKLYQIASEAGMDDVADMAKGSLLTRMKALFSSSSTSAMLEDLPKRLLVDLFSSFASVTAISSGRENVGYSQHLYTPPSPAYSPTSPHYTPESPPYEPPNDACFGYGWGGPNPLGGWGAPNPW